MLYIAEFKDGSQAKLEVCDYRGALQLIELKYHKPTRRVRRAGLLDLAYRSAEQFSVHDPASYTYREVA